MKYIINPLAVLIGWIGLGLFISGEFFMYLSDGIKR